MTISIRDLQGMDEFRAAEQLQIDVWGADEMPDPADLMMVIQHEGGLIAGAFEGDRLLGYVFAFPTRDNGVQHSHRLAVRTEARGLQLGARLKWYQHDWCAARGIRHVRWTYDPARRANATLNIAKLGAEASTYLTDYYGALPGINAGTATDRVMADWWIGSDRVRAAREGRASLTQDQLASAHRVPIPGDFERLLQIDPPAAQSARMAMRTALTSAFDQGLFIAGMDRATGDYLLLPR